MVEYPEKVYLYKNKTADSYYLECDQKVLDYADYIGEYEIHTHNDGTFPHINFDLGRGKGYFIVCLCGYKNSSFFCVLTNKFM